jgi:hypothetical protein
MRTTTAPASSKQPVNGLKKSVAAYLDASLQLEPTPQFRLSVGWFLSYEALFQGKPNETTPIEDLVNRSIATGRVLISGKGGGAKSVVIRRLMRKTLESPNLPVVFDLKKWTSIHYEDWKKLEGTVTRMDYLFSSLGFGEFSVMQLDALPPDLARLIFVDGLNEVAQNTGQEIIATIDDYAQYAVNTGIIVADRMVRRTFIDAQRWGLSTILPLEEGEIRAQLKNKFGNDQAYEKADASTRALLSTPYFLNSLVTDGTPTGRTSSETIDTYFTTHASLSENEIDAAAEAAYRSYDTFRSRTFRIESFTAQAGVEVTRKLIDTNAILTTGDLGSFDHHLKHDFLASRYVVKNPRTWSPDTLGVLTFNASSFDALFMALQQTSDTESADRFIRLIYDWNPYGAAYALTEGGSQGRTLVSDEMETVIITMLAERQWDLMTATQTKARDALSLFPPDRVRNFFSSSHVEDLFLILKAIQSDKNWFDQWRTLFTQSGPNSLEGLNFAVIFERDSLLGWTIANVVKRLPISEEVQERFRHSINEQNGTVRWRIVHVLGSFPSAVNVTFLFDRLDHDDYHWVRYGATRSLVESAATGSLEIRTMIFDGIRHRAEQLLKDEKSMREFESAIFVDPKRAPKAWVETLGPVIEAFYCVDNTFERREQWRQLAYRLKGRYAS